MTILQMVLLQQDPQPERFAVKPAEGKYLGHVCCTRASVVSGSSSSHVHLLVVVTDMFDSRILF